MMKGALQRFAFQLVHSKPYLAALYRYLYEYICRNVNYAVNCNVFLPPVYLGQWCDFTYQALPSLILLHLFTVSSQKSLRARLTQSSSGPVT